MVPVVVPFTDTVAPGTPSPVCASVTFPLTKIFCENAEKININCTAENITTFRKNPFLCDFSVSVINLAILHCLDIEY